ncbi:ureidoglycolate dehydrogenase [Staphylococcus pseudoxylosus]|uniref:ureidoglycolate dehydrogenase n=1 Tax=Staphylococcus pseudoxylosus TaxID=2282419 RepID=UPI000D1D533A|nr:ureidoglycolate dehydrogenase [Staphylococcus pseudoxylosus]MDW8797209.1 ureidoglycolate dehydrogenase [Staphylococcus pseudoxylosus]MEB8085577.1 ureidoglycolate dehydrogenase [Staphylococcus pseudoxylosus]PTI44507.1 ureidoglycolate dehydrogenase [Staphylococcus xylosus]
MEEETLVYVERDKLRELFKKKLTQAGLPEVQADKTADLMIFADERGIHSHGSVRMQYYAERISKQGYNLEPSFEFTQNGPSAGTYFGDNAVGHYVAYQAMEEAITMAENSGIGMVGVKEIGHSGAIGYFAEQAAKRGMVAITVCQSDPMVVPYGGTKPYFGTNPIAFAAPRQSGEPILFDMATTVQAWGKILDARSKHKSIPDTWAVDNQGEPTSDPFEVAALLPVAGPKGYGLMMMVDILAGSLLGLPFGQHVTSMYKDLSQYRRLGQFHIVINPAYFGDETLFLEKVSEMVDELHDIKPAQGFEQVYYPGEIQETVKHRYAKSGIPVAESIYDYLVSEQLY